MKECPFCSLQHDPAIIARHGTAMAVYDKYPVNKGHVLIIPLRHCLSYFDLTDSEQSDCWTLLSRMKQHIEKLYSPDGFNVGINVGEEAGQTIPHVHLHLIPRYKGDVKDPEGGVRGVVPEKRKYRENE
jgi:ATP adenylyltransferase